MPEKGLQDSWDVQVTFLLNKLLEQKIESESLDFKVRINELSNHICAMANTAGGFLVLGINEQKTSNGKKVIRFIKEGISENEINVVEQQIRESIANVEPVPRTRVKALPDSGRYYIVLEVKDEDSKKPFFVKNRCQCFIRIRDGTYPATRLMVSNMFQNSISLIKNIQKLRSTTVILKGELEATINYLSSVSPNDQTRPSKIDLSFIRDAINSNYDFLSEKNLIGDIHNGIIHAISAIGKLNSQIEAYNTITDPQVRHEIRYQMIEGSRVLAIEISGVLKFLETVMQLCEGFLQKEV